MVAAWLFLILLRLAYLPTYLTFSWALLVFAAPAVVGSVWLGRWSRAQGERAAPASLGSELPAPGRGGRRLARTGVRVGNGVVVLAALVGFGNAHPDPVYVNTSNGNPGYTGSGLAYQGQPVDNVYVYDAQGHRLTDVRLFGADGKSLVIDRTTDVIDPGVTIPGRSDVYGQWWTNVFPRPYVGYGDPYGLNPQADPSNASYYTGQTQWKPPPSVAPLAPAPTGPPSAAATSLPGDTTSGGPARTTAPTSAPTTAPSGPSTRPSSATLPVTATTGPGGSTVTGTGTPAG